LKKFLDNDLRACRPERARETGFDCSACLFGRRGDDDPLARCKPIGLDDDGQGLSFQIRECRVSIAKAPIGGSRNVELRAQILGEALRALEARGCGIGSEIGNPGRIERIAEPADQRRLRTDHDEIHHIVTAEGNDGIMVGDVESDAFGLLGDAGISRRTVEFFKKRAGRHGPGQCVLAAARANQKNIHRRLDCCGVPDVASGAKETRMECQGE